MITFTFLDLVCNTFRLTDVIEHLSKGLLIAENIYQIRINEWELQYDNLASDTQEKTDKHVEQYD